jgi:hypothetical protein
MRKNNEHKTIVVRCEASHFLPLGMVHMSRYVQNVFEK